MTEKISPLRENWRHRWLARIAVASIVCFPAGAGASASSQAMSISVTASGWTASEAARVRLASGKVVVETRAVRGSDYPLFRGYGVINASPERVWAVIEDCANYDKNLSRIAESELVFRRGRNVRCKTVLEFPAPLPNAHLVSDAVHESLPGRRFVRTWRFVEGDFDENRGSWTILPFDSGGESSLVIYETHAEPHISVPASILKLAQRRAMPQLFERLRSVL